MTISKELEAEILRLYHVEKWKVNTIATQLRLHHATVRRILERLGVLEKPLRSSLIDPYVPFIKQTLEKYPQLNSARLHEMVKSRGYPGGADHFRHLLVRLRPTREAEAYLRVRTLAGEQAQVDWAHFGKIEIGKASRPLMAFVMVLSWSRRIFLRFYMSQSTANFLRGHVEAFHFFAGVPKEILYDNLKSAVIERVGTAIRFNERLLSMAAHYRFQPKPVNVARGNEKGRVERSIQYARGSFYAGRQWKSLEDLNEQALVWCQSVASQRQCVEDRSLTVGEAYEQERGHLLSLPDNDFECDERVEVKVGKTPYARFDSNDYSVPHTQVRKVLTIVASTSEVRIFSGVQEVARHKRSFDKGQQVENPGHITELEELKKAAGKHRSVDRLYHATPSSRELFKQAAERGLNLGGLTSGLVHLLNLYGAKALEAAVKEVLDSGAIHLSAVKQVLERRRKELGMLPPVEVELPNDPRITDLVVTPHPLASYDELYTQPQGGDND